MKTENTININADTVIISLEEYNKLRDCTIELSKRQSNDHLIYLNVSTAGYRNSDTVFRAIKIGTIDSVSHEIKLTNKAEIHKDIRALLGTEQVLLSWDDLSTYESQRDWLKENKELRDEISRLESKIGDLKHELQNRPAKKKGWF